MCACKETDVRESPNDSILPGGEGQGSRGETCHPQYRENPSYSMAEHPLHQETQEYRKSQVKPPVKGLIRYEELQQFIELRKGVQKTKLVIMHTKLKSEYLEEDQMDM
jgi:hypothetical protein